MTKIEHAFIVKEIMDDMLGMAITFDQGPEGPNVEKYIKFCKWTDKYIKDNRPKCYDLMYKMANYIKEKLIGNYCDITIADILLTHMINILNDIALEMRDGEVLLD